MHVGEQQYCTPVRQGTVLCLAENRLDGQIWQLGNDIYSESYTYNSTIDGSLNTMTVKDGSATIATLTMGYDRLRRRNP